MTAAWNLGASHMRAATVMGVPLSVAQDADHVVEAAQQLGTAERLERAISYAAQATGRWRHFMTSEEVSIREIASWVGVSEMHYEQWRDEEYLCQTRTKSVDCLATGS